MRSHQMARLFCALLVAGFGAAGAPGRAEDMAAVALPEAGPPAVVVAPTPTPEAAAVMSGLAAATADLPPAEAAAIRSFYAARDYAPFWAEAGGDRLTELSAAVGASAEQALPPARYDVDAGAAPDPAATEVAAMRAYLRFATDLSVGVLTPSAIYPEISRRPVRPSPDALLARLGTGPIAEVLAGLEPPSPDYRRLIAEKARLEGLAQSASWGPEVPDGPTLHPGESGPRVAELRSRLARLGYVVPTDELAGSGFDAGLQQSVEQFQSDYGLNDDGVVGAMTLAAINAPVETRLAQVVVNLERLRWMNRDLGARYLMVNIPDFTVNLIEGGASVWNSKVVVGKTNVTETPEFDGVVRTMVVNPTWHIPDSIAIRDYLPKLQRDPMVLKRQNIRLLTRGGTEINPKLVDFTQYTPENFPFRIKQRPSDDNALGEVKFLFPNEFSVYMHDTPHRELFAREVRAFSNGCIRLQKPVELAHIVLTGQVPDPAATYEALHATGKEHAVALQRPIPVHIVYRTVWFDDTGAAHYRPDVYGRDAAVYEALQAAGVRLPAAQG